MGGALLCRASAIDGGPGSRRSGPRAIHLASLNGKDSDEIYDRLLLPPLAPSFILRWRRYYPYF